MDEHRKCNLDEPCRAGDAETCPAVEAKERRRVAGEPLWGKLELTEDRHYLGGQPISCGTVLILQGIAYRHDDYGEYIAHLNQGLPVRYEVVWLLGLPSMDARVRLHVSACGHEFTTELRAWMRFRWPRERQERHIFRFANPTMEDGNE